MQGFPAKCVDAIIKGLDSKSPDEIACRILNNIGLIVLDTHSVVFKVVFVPLAKCGFDEVETKGFDVTELIDKVILLPGWVGGNILQRCKVLLDF